MAASTVVFVSGLSTTVAVIPTTGAWFAMDRDKVKGTIWFEVKTNTSWQKLSYVDGEGKTANYALTPNAPAVRIPGPFIADSAELRLNAKGAQGVLTGSVIQYA